MHKKFKTVLFIGILQIPCFLLYSIFFTWPMIQVVYLSLFEWNGMVRVPKIFIGLQNFIALLQNIDFYRSLENSLIFVLVAVVVIMPISFLLALLLNSGLRGTGFFKSAYYIPSVLPTAVAGLLWAFMLSSPGGSLNPDGVITQVIQAFLGSDIHIRWLSSKELAIWSVTMVQSWRLIGFYMLFFLTGLTSIPREIIEAAIADGAGSFKRLVYIIIPNMKETFKIFLILNLAGAFQIFDIVYIMTMGGPGNATQVPVTLLYNYSFRFYGSFGYGAAIGVVILIISMVIAAVTNHKLNQED